MTDPNIAASVIAVARSPTHSFSKKIEPSIELLAGLGVLGDAHSGQTAQHLYTRRKKPGSPNLCQVHLLPVELFEELNVAGFEVRAGDLGENVVTSGLDLQSLPLGSRLRIGGQAVVEVTGVRDPCSQINRFKPGLMNALISRDRAGRKVRKAGIMSIVLQSGLVRAGDEICIDCPPPPYRELLPV